MEKVKVFYACNNSALLEESINKWLGENRVTIVRVLQSASGRMDHKVTITIFYNQF